MKVIDIISEKRSNLDLNPKPAVGHVAAIEYLKSLENEEGFNKIGVSLTVLPKLGINPLTKYDTPVGVYFYPVEYYIDTISSGGELPYAHNAPHIQIFKYNTDRILYIDEITQKENDIILSKLIENSKKLGVDLEFIEDAYYVNALNSARVKTLGGKLWYTTFQIASEHDNPPVMWNKILRNVLDYDVVYDNGSGIIHENEPSQGCVLNPKVIKRLKMINATMDESSIYPRYLFYNAITNRKPLSNSIEKKILSSHSAKFDFADFIRYARTFYLGKEWPAAEEFLFSDPYRASEYEKYVLGRKWNKAWEMVPDFDKYSHFI